ARDPRGGEHIGLGHIVGAHQPHYLRGGAQLARRGRDPGGLGLGADINHMGAALGVHMRQLVHSDHTRTGAPTGSSPTSAGTSMSTSAAAMLATRCEPGPDTTSTARGPPAVWASRPRRNWRRPCGERMALSSGSSNTSTSPSPASLRSIGRANTSNETIALTGLPGKLSTGTPSTTVSPCGPPGCTATGPNCPPIGSSTSLTTSKSPLDTPPVVNTTSAERVAADRVRRNCAGWSPLCSTAVTVTPFAVSAAASAMPFES